MSTNRTIKRTIQREDARLDRLLRSVGLTVDEYRAIRFLFRAVGIAIVAAALFHPEVHAAPVPTLTILAAFVLGPDVAEAYLTRGE